MMTITTDVLVIGAGPTGLTIANLLTRNGVSVRIMDKKSELARESRAIVVHAKTLELLDKLGLADKAIETGEQLGGLQFLTQGKRAGKFSFQDSTGDKRTPYPFALIYGQDQTEHLLLQSLTEVGCQVEWDTELLSLEQTQDGAQAHVRTADGSEETIEAQWIIGADGAHSPVRHALSLGFAGQSYTQTLFVADLDIEWKQEAHQGAMNLTHQEFFLFFPMPQKRRFRLFGSLTPAEADRDTLTLDDVRQILDTKSGLHVTILKDRWISVYHTHQRMAERFRVGRVFLVGDAAHIHSPAGGQGMNTGIGDAYNLAWKLALVIKGQANETLLDSYEAERMPFARAILQGSDWAFQIMTTSNVIVRQFKLILLPQFFRLISLLPLLKQRAFWILSQLWTSYPKSPAVTDASSNKKKLRAGDRAPYGFFETGPDAGKSIFTMLKNQDHHLFIFAGSKPDSTLTDLQGLEEKLRSLLSAYAVPIHLHSVPTANLSLHRSYEADTPSLFLIRPDGHIAYRGQPEDLAKLKLYLNKLFKLSGNPAQATKQEDTTALTDEHTLTAD
ncbi:oxygenase [Dictyobacter vulcani]|uniref:Oxygenase n=1 Tax=Dictyobacter vulcani TaxID=2607529 RepID=A0A5J4KR23_9CHLR|nr:FAD-dependent monooxygenase [Dictyobacter vulcani]GER90335.1 oxygenase [Dictyobacter vulcani]